jgi:polyribonucleotide nucleotidyltransferase
MVDTSVLTPEAPTAVANGISTPLAPNDFFTGQKRASFQLGEHTVFVETGRMARQAGASVLVQCGETIVMVAATGAKEPRAGIDFFPLLVDYEERMFAVGRFPGGYLKREGRPSEKAVLTSRLIDRPIRPLFPDGYRNDVQVVATPLAYNADHQPDMLAMFGASLALTLAPDVPFQGPIGAVRVGRINGQFVLNPTHEDQAKSDLDLIVSGTADSIIMVEAGADFITEAALVDALELAQEAIKQQVAFQLAFAQVCGVDTSVGYTPDLDVAPLKAFVAEVAQADLAEAYHNNDRDQRKALADAAKSKAKAAIEALADDHPVKQLLASTELNLFGEAFKSVEKHVMRRMVVEEGLRADGRKPEEIRPINVQVGVLPRVHGSALFTRGSTQALSIATLGSPGDAQDLDGIDPATKKRWLHHYSFPAYSVGEVRPNRGASRREIGHGALAERAVGASLPTELDFPYSLRVNSEVLESNGSSSMASTCGATLALMDAGVPLTQMVGGIAMGLIKEGNDVVILSDIQGLEDFLGDMDFKVTGSEQGVTALQMDIKIQGISVEIIRNALAQAKEGRLHILNKMREALPAPRTQLSPWAPRIFSVQIDPDSIGAIIGPGGKMIRSITEETGTSIDIDDSGLVTITAPVGGGAERAIEIIQNLTRKFEPGTLIKGKVVGMIPVGAFVQLCPGKDGMIHISQFPFRVPTVDSVVSVGDEVLVRVVDVDDKGRISLTMRGLTPEEFAAHGVTPPVEPPPEAFENLPPRPDRGDRGGFRGGGGGDRGGRPPRRDRY